MEMSTSSKVPVPSSAEVPVENALERLAREQQTKWQCAACLIFNKPDTKQCPACDVWREGYRPTKEELEAHDRRTREREAASFGVADSSTFAFSFDFGAGADCEGHSGATGFSVDGSATDGVSTGFTFVAADGGGDDVDKGNGTGFEWLSSGNSAGEGFSFEKAEDTDKDTTTDKGPVFEWDVAEAEDESTDSDSKKAQSSGGFVFESSKMTSIAKRRPSKHRQVVEQLTVDLKKACGLLDADSSGKEPSPMHFPFEHSHEWSEDESEKENWETSDDEIEEKQAKNDDDDDNDDSECEGKDKEDGGFVAVLKTEVSSEIASRVQKLKKQVERRSRVRQSLQQLAATGSIEEGTDFCMVSGEGGLSGILGRSIGGEDYPVEMFPALIPSLTNMDIDLVVTGSMSCAVVCNERSQLYVWGNNEQSQLGTDPLSIPDLGDDDDEVDTETVQTRIRRVYESRWNTLYLKYAPSDVSKVKKLLDKYCTVARIKKFGPVKVIENLQKTYVKIGEKYGADASEIASLPRVEIRLTEAEKKERAMDKLRPFADGCGDEHSPDAASASRTTSPAPSSKPKKRATARSRTQEGASESGGGKDESRAKSARKRRKSEMTPSAAARYSYYFGTTTKRRKVRSDREEDELQTDISCTYYTPAELRLPLSFARPIVDVSMGNCHMVVLDSFGKVYSCGTFKNEDGIVGHHKLEDNSVVRFQRTLMAMDQIQSFDDGMAYASKRLPPVSMIASGANHFLMLAVDGEIWEMGVTQLGQRSASRLQKKRLAPHPLRTVLGHRGTAESAALHSSTTSASASSTRTSFTTPTLSGTTTTKSKVAVKFKQIACGEHHNLAIADGGQLYSWGQNNFLQCGHPETMNGHNNVIDAPHRVHRYQSLKAFTEHCQEYKEAIADCDLVGICKVMAGSHFSVALDVDGNVWTFGRNACDQLGRFTKREAPQSLAGESRQIRQERMPDLARMVPQLKECTVDWVGCGSSFWFAHNADSGRLYAYGDAGEGSCGVGNWRSARGRAAFDERLLPPRFSVLSATGGANHSLFWLRYGDCGKKRLASPSSSVDFASMSPTTSTISSRGNSLLLSRETTRSARRRVRRPSGVASTGARRSTRKKRKRKRTAVRETDDGSSVQRQLDDMSLDGTESHSPTTKKVRTKRDESLSETPIDLMDADSLKGTAAKRLGTKTKTRKASVQK